MNLRTASVAALACAAVLILGCAKKNGAKVGVKQTSAKNDVKTLPEAVTHVGPLESHHAHAKFDPSARHFVLFDNIRIDGRFILLPGVEGPMLATQIHRDHVDHFLNQLGAGIGRMREDLSKWPDWTELVAVSPSERNLGGDRGGGGAIQYDPTTESLALGDGTRQARRERVWLLRDRQLVSANAATGPAVYVQAPRTQQELMKPKPSGAFVDKRRLDAFEEEALKKLRVGEEVALRSDDRELRMLGAIRARTDCLSCHDGGEGTLLGAFSYTLKLQSEETPEPHRLADKAGLTDQQLSAVRSIEAIGGKVIRTPGGPVTEVRMTFSRNQETAAKPSIRSTRLTLRDSALPHLLAFPELTVLDVSNSLVSDAGLKTIAELKSLKRLDLRQTWATVAGVAELKKALPKCEVITDRPVP